MLGELVFEPFLWMTYCLAHWHRTSPTVTSSGLAFRLPFWFCFIYSDSCLIFWVWILTWLWILFSVDFEMMLALQAPTNNLLTDLRFTLRGEGCVGQLLKSPWRLSTWLDLAAHSWGLKGLVLNASSAEKKIGNQCSNSPNRNKYSSSCTEH